MSFTVMLISSCTSAVLIYSLTSSSHDTRSSWLISSDQIFLQKVVTSLGSLFFSSKVLWNSFWLVRNNLFYLNCWYLLSYLLIFIPLNLPLPEWLFGLSLLFFKIPILSAMTHATVYSKELDTMMSSTSVLLASLFFPFYSQFCSFTWQQWW